MNKVKLGVIGLVGALGLAIAGCGNATPVSHSVKPTPSASTKATQPSGLTLAQVTSGKYMAQFPLVACSTLSTASQSAWGPLLLGSGMKECAPASFLTKDVPTIVKVNNQDPHITQSQADAYGRALLVTLGWEDWASEDAAPAVLPVIGQAGGANAQYYEAMAQGEREITWPGFVAYPNQITLYPITPQQGKTIMDGATQKFVLIASFLQRAYSAVGQMPGQAPKLMNESSNALPQIFTGSIETSPVLGTYFKVNTYSDNCTAAPTVDICEAAGVY